MCSRQSSKPLPSRVMSLHQSIQTTCSTLTPSHTSCLRSAFIGRSFTREIPKNLPNGKLSSTDLYHKHWRRRRTEHRRPRQKPKIYFGGGEEVSSSFQSFPSPFLPFSPLFPSPQSGPTNPAKRFQGVLLAQPPPPSGKKRHLQPPDMFAAECLVAADVLFLLNEF